MSIFELQHTWEISNGAHIKFSITEVIMHVLAKQHIGALIQLYPDITEILKGNSTAGLMDVPYQHARKY